MKRKKIILTVLLAAAGAAAVIIIVLAVQMGGPSLPSFIVWKEKTFSADADADGKEDAFALKGRRLRITAGTVPDKAVYETEQDIFVQDAFAADLDHDGVPEVILLTWRRGSFGNSKPFWIEEDDDSYSQHIFIYHYENGGLTQVWLSSDIGTGVREMSVDENARIHLISEAGNESLWAWEDWGLRACEMQGPAAD